MDFTLGAAAVARASGNGASATTASALVGPRRRCCSERATSAAGTRSCRPWSPCRARRPPPLVNLAELLGRQSPSGRGAAVTDRALATLPADLYLRRLARSLDAGARLDAIADRSGARLPAAAEVMLDLHAPAGGQPLGAFGDDAPPPVVIAPRARRGSRQACRRAVAMVESARARDRRTPQVGRVLAQLRASAARWPGAAGEQRYSPAKMSSARAPSRSRCCGQ